MKIELPPHHQLYITHNAHRTNYESVSDYVSRYPHMMSDMSKNEFDKCILADEIWEIKLYPITPISFFWVAASTFERALELINEAAIEAPND